MAGFDRSKFIKANEESGKSDFFTPEIGFYMCELTRAFTGNAKTSGDFQACFTWKIAEDSERDPGKSFSKYIKLDGEHAEQGYAQLARYLSGHGYQNDPEVFASNPDGEMETLIGTKVRIQVAKNPKSEQFPYININRLEYSPLGDVGSATTAPEDTDLITPEPESNEDSVEVGDLINITGCGICTVKFVNEEQAQVVAEVMKSKETVVKGVGDIEGMICKKDRVPEYLAKTTPKAVTQTEKTPEAKPLPKAMEKVVEEVVDLPEEIEALAFEIGMMVEAKYKADKIVGKIHALELDKGIVKVLMNRSVYPCKVETVKLVS